ncbi:MAG: OmpA family protein [Chromatiales bacterium]|nr:OmpA family protein [Chromatiales bacterium]
MSLRAVLILLFSLGLSLPALAGQIRYGANEHQSDWQADGNRLFCRLSHEVPRYGLAIFERRAGGELGFRLETRLPPRQVAMARLVSAPPQWKHDTLIRDLGQVDIRTERASMHLPEAQARRLLLELEHGMFPSFSFSDWADGRDSVTVALSAVRVRQALGEFQQCLDSQLPYGFEQVRDTRVHFAFDKSELSPEARRRLDVVAEFMRLDERIDGVVLEGHADSRGWPRYNDALSLRRAEAVREYLIAQGVDAEKFQFDLRAYGERRPLASNRTEAGRAQNRTVIVSLQGG